MPRLQDKVAIVTGSSSGLGRAISLAYAREGAHIVCADLTPTARKDVVIASEQDAPTHEEITRSGGKAIFVQTDVTSASSIDNAVQAAVKEYGRLDIAVNNAGIAVTEMHYTHEVPDDEWDKTMLVNSKGVFLGCRAAIRQMLKQDLHPSGDRGWIVNTASMLGLVGYAGTAAYSASKGSVVLLTKTIALEYAAQKIHCNCLCPGFVDTAMTKPILDDAGIRQHVTATHPWGRLGKPQDVAKVAVFLASEDAGYVTGVPLPVDGGFTAQ